MSIFGRVLISFSLLLPLNVWAQNQSGSSAVSGQQLLKSEQLEALVAPIALYPDTLLAQVLIASTYPLEVVHAQRWTTENKSLKGDRLKTEIDKQAWDESVKSLAATPSILTMMSSKLDWTQKLGDAVLAQQPDVMDAIQRLRSKAQANNKLTSTKEQKVTVKQEQNRKVIAIEPATPDTVYVPYYDPAVVYGAWPYAEYPPYYYYPPGYNGGGLLATGLAFGAGYALGRWTGGNSWGGSINWSGGGNNIQINRGAHVEHWQHSPEHRQGVRYNNDAVRQKFGGKDRTGSAARNDFRGRSGEQVLKPGVDRGSAGDRSQPNRPSTGNREQTKRPSTGDRGPGKQASAKKGSQGGARPSGGDRGPTKQASAKRPSSGANRPARDSAFGNIGSGNAARLQSQRGRASLGGGARGGGPRVGGGGRSRGGGGGFSGRGGGGRGGGRRSDIRLKHDITLLGRLSNGLGFYRFEYNGSNKAYVGVIAQEVEAVSPQAVTRGRDGYLRVYYNELGLKLETYRHWIVSGAKVPEIAHQKRADSIWSEPRDIEPTKRAFTP